MLFSSMTRLCFWLIFQNGHHEDLNTVGSVIYFYFYFLQQPCLLSSTRLLSLTACMCLDALNVAVQTGDRIPCLPATCGHWLHSWEHFIIFYTLDFNLVVSYCLHFPTDLSVRTCCVDIYGLSWNLSWCVLWSPGHWRDNWHVGKCRPLILKLKCI